MDITKDPPLTPQAPSEPLSGARARAIRTEVNSFIFELPIDLDKTWLLPQSGTYA